MAFKYNGNNVDVAKISSSVGYVLEGTPTLQQGILSNIDSTNYITTNTSFNTTSSFSIILKYKLLADGNLTYFVGNTDGFKFYSTSTNANNLGGMIRASSEDEWTYLNVPSISHQANTWYILQFDYNGTNIYTVTVKNENETVLGTSTTTSNIKVAAGDICFGYNGGSAAEEIDFNNTYIYINNKLWFWQPMEANYVMQNGGQTGYTIVGSPTIEDGVVSNFSMNDYLIMTSSYPTEITSFEKQIKFTTPTEWPSGYFALIGSTNYDRIIFTTSYYCLVSLNHSRGIKDIRFQYAFQSSTTYILKATLQNQIVNISLFNTSGTLLKTQDTEFPYVNVPNTTPRIGQSTADGGGYWRGSIDLKETYIKVNGEYFFNGASKLVWANPHLYLQGPNTYTKVGNVDITDNIASGFSSSNYLNISSFPNLNVDFTSQVVFTSNADSQVAGLFCGTSWNYNGWHLVSGALYFSLRVSDGENSPMVRSIFATQLLSGTSYKAIAIRVGNNVVCSLYLGNTKIEEQSFQVDTGYNVVQDINYRVGYSAPGAFDGSIDLNQTYIKVNDVLWFYGRNYATQNIAPVPNNYTYGATTTTGIGFVDTRTQKYTELPSGVTLGNDSVTTLKRITINAPSGSTVTINGQQTNSLALHEGDSYTYSVTKTDYKSLTGSGILNDNVTINVATLNINITPSPDYLEINNEEISGILFEDGTSLSYNILAEKNFYEDLELSGTITTTTIITQSMQELGPLCFTANSAGSTISYQNRGTSTYNMQYSTDLTNWASLNANTNVTLSNIGDKVYFKADNPSGMYYYVGGGTVAPVFSMTGSISASGNANSLINSTNYNSLTTLPNYAFYGLFKNCTSLTSMPYLPSTTLGTYAYSYMFSGCNNLTDTTNLPCSTLNTYCYEYMFSGCSSLVKTPNTTITNFADGSCSNMFRSCTSLTEVDINFNTTTFPQSCCIGMFTDCSSLVSTPYITIESIDTYSCSSMFSFCSLLENININFNADTLGNYSYSYMFRSCTSLENAVSILPATTLSNYCYYNMFVGCTSLTKAPELPATTLATACYQNMFSGCTSLNEIKIGYTGNFNNNFNNWVTNVSSTGTLYYNGTDTTTGNNAIPTGWTVSSF